MLEERLAKGSTEDAAGFGIAVGAKGAGFAGPVLNGSVLGAVLEPKVGFAEGWLNGSLLATDTCGCGGGLLLKGSLRKSSSSPPLSYPVDVVIIGYVFCSVLNGSSLSSLLLSGN